MNMKKSTSGALNVLAGVLLSVFVLGQLSFVNNENKRIKNEDKWQPPALPEKMDFATEAVPLERWDIKERLDREVLFNFYGHANVLFLLKLSNRYFPTISGCNLKTHQLSSTTRIIGWNTITTMTCR